MWVSTTNWIISINCCCCSWHTIECYLKTQCVHPVRRFDKWPIQFIYLPLQVYTNWTNLKLNVLRVCAPSEATKLLRNINELFVLADCWSCQGRQRNKWKLCLVRTAGQQLLRDEMKRFARFERCLPGNRQDDSEYVMSCSIRRLPDVSCE